MRFPFYTIDDDKEQKSKILKQTIMDGRDQKAFKTLQITDMFVRKLVGFPINMELLDKESKCNVNVKPSWLQVELEVCLLHYEPARYSVELILYLEPDPFLIV